MAIGSEDLFVAVGLARKVAFAEIDDASKDGLLLILFAFALALLGATISGWYFVRRPIGVLLDCAQRWSAGDYGARPKLSGAAAEFRRMGEAFGQMAGTIEQRERELFEANRTKNQLLAGAGHDLKQPLQTIAAALALLPQRHLDTAGEAHVARAERAVRRLTQALDSLLEASRIESGTVRPEREILPVGEILLAIGEEFAAPAAEKGLRFTVMPSSALIESDPHLLEAILQNLVSNAVKYTSRGRILVGCRRRGAMLSIEVIDTGIGIPRDKLDAVFEAFRRLNPRSGSGMGLGLAIVRRLTVLLGHRLEVRSTVGRGSRFSLTVPLVTGGGDMDLPEL